jgi:hypothetical protein
MSVKIKGFDELTKSLKQMDKTLKNLDGKQMPFNDLFTKSFMEKYTSVSSFDEFLLKGNFKVDSQSDFESIPDDVFDAYVSSNTSFKSWNDMLEKATDQYLSKLLKF